MSVTNLGLTDYPCSVCGSIDHDVLFPDTLGNGLLGFSYGL